ncbi:zinc finger protein 99-like [Ctenocephalides felis]|uniref:zinc finger protein 99-like n=1 Tax=Ctenocephalides felis TaxID=7515 RepID=UPI000E6E4F82|nr:zinc finger protein 99-like [Ctenocephalides felis]
MSKKTIMSVNDQTIKIEPPEYSPEDIKLEMEDEFDDPDVVVKSESCSEDDDTCLERFMNSEVTIEEEVKQELVETSTYESHICHRSFAESDHLKDHMADYGDMAPEDIKLEMEDEFDDIDVTGKSESCSEDDDTCLERFMNSEVTIEEEVKQELVETSTYECHICNRTFTKTNHLKEHMMEHLPHNSKESPFKCEICYKTFNQLGNVKKHMLIHSGYLN